MAFALDRIAAAAKLLNPNGTVSQWFQRLWQKNCELIEAQEASQDATLARIRRCLSHTVPTTILVATEDGVDVTVEVLDHTRVYADATTLAVTGTTFTGKAADTLYACYYDDTTLADSTPTFVLTTDVDQAPAAMADGRHFCGFILTPALASGSTIQSGGAYAGGTSLYGEIESLL